MHFFRPSFPPLKIELKLLSDFLSNYLEVVFVSHTFEFQNNDFSSQNIRVRKITGFILMDEGPLCCPIPIWPQKIWNSGEGKSNLPHLRIRCNQKSNRFSDFSHWLVCLRRLCCWKSTFSFSRKLGSEVFRIHHQVFSLQRGPPFLQGFSLKG